MGMGVSDDAFEAALTDVRHVIDGLGELVDSYCHQLPGLALRHERIFAQYANRCQIDLVVIPASQSIGPVRDEIVLHNQGEHEVSAFEQQTLTAEQLREWAFAGWCALVDFGKQLPQSQRALLPTAMASYVSDDLAGITIGQWRPRPGSPGLN